MPGSFPTTVGFLLAPLNCHHVGGELALILAGPSRARTPRLGTPKAFDFSMEPDDGGSPVDKRVRYDKLVDPRFSTRHSLAAKNKIGR